MATLQSWASQGRVVPGSTIRDVSTGQLLIAHQLPALNAIFNRPPSMQTMMGGQSAYQSPVHGIRVVPGTHSVVVAVILTLLCLVGAGQMYNKQVIKGVVVLMSAIALAVITVGFSIIFTFPLAAIDAGMIASRLNKGEVVGEWQWF